MRRILKNTIGVLLLTFLLLGVPKAAGMIASLFEYQAIDPDGAFAWISVHHIIQALIFIMIIIVLNRIRPLEYGFGWGNKEIGWKYVRTFTIMFSVGSLATHVLTIFSGSFQPFAYPLSTTNIIGHLSFQLLLSGPSEELIFRAFAITMLALFIKKRFFKKRASAANIIAAVIFGIAHVSFSFAPFAVSYNLFQVILAAVLGFFYGDCYEKSKSMYYPMLMHSISNVVMVGYAVIATVIMNG